MVTALSIAVAGLSILVVFFGTLVVNLRARTFRQAAEIRALKGAPQAATSPMIGEHRASASVIAIYDEDMDIPAALVGAQCKKIIEHFAPALGVKPVRLLRSVLIDGLTGCRLITDDLLNLLDQLVKDGDVLVPPSKPPAQPS